MDARPCLALILTSCVLCPFFSFFNSSRSSISRRHAAFSDDAAYCLPVRYSLAICWRLRLLGSSVLVVCLRARQLSAQRLTFMIVTDSCRQGRGNWFARRWCVVRSKKSDEDSADVTLHGPGFAPSYTQTVEAGDHLTFRLIDGEHWVVQSLFESPCVSSGSFVSPLTTVANGTSDDAGPWFTFTVSNSSEPLYFSDLGQNGRNCFQGAVLYVSFSLSLWLLVS